VRNAGNEIEYGDRDQGVDVEFDDDPDHPKFAAISHSAAVSNTGAAEMMAMRVIASQCALSLSAMISSS
jgi:hypothetical protein